MCRRPGLLFFLLGSWLLLPASLYAQVTDREEIVEAVKDFKRLFKQFKQGAERREAVMTLATYESPEAVSELLKLLEHKDGDVQQTALAVLVGYKSQATFQPWIDGFAEADSGDQAVLAKVFGRAGIRGAASAIQSALAAGSSDAEFRFEAMRALSRIGDASAAEVVGPVLGDADANVRMAACDCVGKLKLKGLGAQLVPLLADVEWPVQTAAITSLGFVRPQEAVQPLIDLMRSEGRLQIECAEALFKITGYDFGVDPDKWQQQWNTLMSIEGWRIPTDEELAKKAESRRKYAELYGQSEGRNTFAGIPTTSTRVLFIIDVSGSMDDLVVEREKFQGHRDFKKFTVVRDNLLEAIDSLTASTFFNIVAFATDLNPWKKKLVPANIINRRAARQWIERLRPIGGTEDQHLAQSGLGGLADLAGGKTNTLKALLYAFGVDPEKPGPKVSFTGSSSDKKRSDMLDTCYFLSDGRPSIGKLVDTREILGEVERYNEDFRIVFHTIAIGEFQKEFLRDLASKNGGVYVDLGR
jgi:hypothetical protein